MSSNRVGVLAFVVALGAVVVGCTAQVEPERVAPVSEPERLAPAVEPERVAPAVEPTKEGTRPTEACYHHCMAYVTTNWLKWDEFCCDACGNC